MPGVMGAIGGAFSALVAGDQAYGDSIGTVFPNRDPPTYEIAIQQKQCNATQVQEGKCALGLTAGEQAGRQVSALLITLALSIAGGLLAGFVAKQQFFEPPRKLFDDSIFWECPEEEEEHKDAKVKELAPVHDSRKPAAVAHAR